MASTVNLSTMQLEDSLLKGARRSRFSFHFNTLRRKRWLLVQLVSVPVDTDEAQVDAPIQRSEPAHKPCKLGNLVDEFRASQMIRHWV